MHDCHDFDDFASKNGNLGLKSKIDNFSEISLNINDKLPGGV